jgi:DNA repair exonuclease SbcCD ATPase subunit
MLQKWGFMMQTSFIKQFYQVLERKKAERGWMGNFADRYSIAQSVLSKIISRESENPRLSNVAKIVDGLVADGDWNMQTVVASQDQNSDVAQLKEKLDAFEKEIELLQKNNVALEKSNVALEKIAKLMETQTETILAEKQSIIESLNMAVTATEREAQSLKQQYEHTLGSLEIAQAERKDLEAEKAELLQQMSSDKEEFETRLDNALAFADVIKNMHAIDDQTQFASYMEEVVDKLEMDSERDNAFLLGIFLQLEKVREKILLRGIFKLPSSHEGDGEGQDNYGAAGGTH